MKLLLPLLMLGVYALASAQVPSPPVAPREAHVVKSPHGDRTDEYHWLRDDNPKEKRASVMQYLQAENVYTEAMLAPLAPLREKLLTELKGRVQVDESTPPGYRHGYWYWQSYQPGQEYPLLMRQRGTPERPDTSAPHELLLDQNQRAQGQDYYSVGSTAISPNGDILAWTEDTTGRRMYTLRFRNLRTGQVYADTVSGVLESLAWANDNRTLFYLQQDKVTLQSGPVYRHRLGSDAASDVKVFEEPDKTLFVDLQRSASGRFVLIRVEGFDTSETRVVDAARPAAPLRTVFARKAQVRHRADHLGDHWVLQTNEDAPNFKLVRAPSQASDDRRRWRTLIPNREAESLERFALLDGGIAVQERVQALSRVRVLARGARTMRVLSPPGSTTELADNPDPRAAYLRYAVTSMIQPQQTWDLHLKRGDPVLRQTRPVPGYDASLYRSDRIWATARDGARVPITLAWRVDRASANRQAPLLLNAYGAYGSSYDPSFRMTHLNLLDRGFVVAIAHVRGGAEMGQAWYEAGRLMNKKNTFNDFMDATQALVQAGWAAPDKVFARGGSAGGLLMGVVANEAPQLYRGIVLNVPFVDIVNTMLDESIPLTTNEWTQWGDPRQKAAYDYLLSYSPYDQLKRQAYPAMLVTGGLWDSQVQYFEPAKYVARLRTLKTDTNPLLLAVNMSAGHGGASGRFAELAEVAREQAFLLNLAGLRD